MTTTTVSPQDWPTTGEGLPLSETPSDDQALIIAKLILEGKPRSYVEGSILLSKYVLALNEQAKLLEEELRGQLKLTGLSIDE
jgi:hypothetical protein